MNISELIDFVSKQSTFFESRGYESVDLPFNILPNEYLTFMEEDLKEDGKRSLVNSLSNAKRSLDCQIDSLLYTFCLYKHASKKNINIPKKIDLLNDIGIIAPRILRKINKMRNTMEHDFYCPEKEEVENFADVILLFNSYTDKFLYNIPYECEIVDNENNNIWITTYFIRNEQIIKIKVIDKSKSNHTSLLTIDASDNLFTEFLKQYISINYDKNRFQGI